MLYQFNLYLKHKVYYYFNISFSYFYNNNNLSISDISRIDKTNKFFCMKKNFRVVTLVFSEEKEAPLKNMNKIEKRTEKIKIRKSINSKLGKFSSFSLSYHFINSNQV